ncbi:thiosulfate/3-mercaptopyruvate sulfurtransferase [Sphingobium sp. B2D3A]|nr:thiosulfate/3-mercaptopyruvate sulfurtransferase [Sphingobium sp. B2D3A]
MRTAMDNLVSTQWLAEQLGAPDLCIVDATRHHFEPERQSAAEYEAGHIPGAVFLDLLHLVDAASPVDNTMPQAEQFSARMRELGISADQRIVIYDDSVVKTAARAWFMFRMYGLPNVAMLDGGLAKWKAEGRPLASGIETRTPSTFTASLDAARLRDKADVLRNIEDKTAQHIDGRGAAHFSGADEDPNPAVASGHVPGSINVPFWDLFEADGTFKNDEALKGVFVDAGADLSKPIITSCGGGVVACALALALERIGKEDVALYDGSWTEWGADPSLPKAKGPAKPASA